jgi:hypothetical protein
MRDVVYLGHVSATPPASILSHETVLRVESCDLDPLPSAKEPTTIAVDPVMESHP